MKNYRLNRLFNAKSNRCFDVAVDHGFFNEGGFLKGIEDIEAAVQTLVEANPDAIQLTIGQAPILQSLPGKGKPALVLRSDVANVYGTDLPDHLFSRVIEDAAEQAVRLDAACLVVNLFNIPGEPEVTDDCIQNILDLKPQCDALAMPLMIEPLVFKPNTEAGGYQVDGDLEKILPLVRQAVELGADVIKADPTDDPADYHQVIQIAGRIPVLVRGGGRVSDEEILQRTHTILAQGAAGIVYGRNIIQHANPAGMTRALMALVHEGATPETAAEHLS
ncbi:MAG TPA: aldolase [Verrucomicrobiales bacterium]|jgi:DhnA family fructose-bisphosphate aldolase class Ia|nr:aldolase [Verrucomicrobiales bacterium]